MLRLVSASYSLFEILAALTVCALAICYAQFHWKRRKMYQMVANMNGPPSLPFIGSTLYFVGSNRDILQNMLGLVDKFQSPVRLWFGPRLFCVVWDPKDLETVFNHPHTLNKGFGYSFMEVGVGGGLITLPATQWKRHRKIIAPTFNRHVLNEFVQTFCKQAEILSRILEEKADKGIFDIYHRYLGRCSLDMVCETVMGITSSAQTLNSSYFTWCEKFMRITHTRMFNPCYHYDFIFKRTSMCADLEEAATNMKNFTKNVVKEKRAAYQNDLQKRKEQVQDGFEKDLGGRKESFLAQLVQISEEGANLTDEELQGEAGNFMLAGTDTIAAATSFVFMILGILPDVQEKVYQEVLDVLGPDRSVEPEDLKKMEYTERVIKETLRIFPLATVLIRYATEDVKLEKFTIPAGTSIFLHIIGVHRNPNVWPDPLRFDPDRHLPEKLAERNSYSWIPFAAGPRNCIGMKFAIMAVKTLIATLIRKYRFHSTYKSIEEVQLKVDLVLKPEDGFNISIKLR